VCATPKGTFFSATAFTSVSDSSIVTVSGFSQNTGIPASRHFIAGSKCTWLGVTIKT